MASPTDICNRALQILGASRITSIDENSVEGRACKAAYEARRDAMLRKNRWRFSIARAQLAADATAPDFGKAAAYQVPSDCLLVLGPYPEDDAQSRDWEIEGRKIYTDESAPLNVRYVSQVTDCNQMDPLFREALSADMAFELCEQITQSNAKKADAKDAKKQALADARRANAFETRPQEAPDDDWITKRA